MQEKDLLDLGSEPGDQHSLDLSQGVVELNRSQFVTGSQTHRDLRPGLNVELRMTYL
jgi:hypothetical protein